MEESPLPDLSLAGGKTTFTLQYPLRRMTPVDVDRLRADLETNAAFGAIDTDDPDARGRTVLTGSEANRSARDYLCDRLEDAGLRIEVDAVGNITGTWASESADPDAPPVAAGSHLDSVPEGGIFDGPLGVYAALEAVRALQSTGAEPDRPLIVVSFTEEEGTRFGGGLLGSSVATGQRSLEDTLALTADDGTTLETALEAIGYRGEGRLDCSAWDAFLEVHVEQDTVLESVGTPVGIVTDVTGITHSSVRIRGSANHAGATAMDERADALAAASEVVLAVESLGQAYAVAGENTAVATVGRCDVSPNATNVIPGEVDLGLDVRDIDGDAMADLLADAERTIREIGDDRGVDTTVERHLEVPPAPMSDRCRDALEAASTTVGVDSPALHSGAAHDAMRISRVTDAGMLFVRSRDGISHNPLEWTDWEDCATAATVLAGALGRLTGCASATIS